MIGKTITSKSNATKICEFLKKKSEKKVHCPSCGKITQRDFVDMNTPENEAIFDTMNREKDIPVYLTMCSNCGHLFPHSKVFIDREIEKRENDEKQN